MKKQLMVKDVLAWGIKSFGYHGHLTKLAHIIGCNPSYFRNLKARSKWVPEHHTDALVSASNGKLKTVERNDSKN